MSSLILNAGLSSAITVNCQRLGKSVPRYVGGRTDSDNGTERSTIRGQKKVIPVSVSPVDTATEASIQAAAFNGAQIPCSGDILGNIQTICSLDVSSEMIPGLPGFFTMTLTLFEVNPSVTLLRYAVGDTVTGESFTRSTVAYQAGSSGSLASVAINTKRDGHYIGGVRSLWLEDTRTNALPRASEFDNAAWTKSGATITANAATGPDGTATADKLVEDATTAAHQAFQGTTTSASAPQAYTVIASAGERTWCYVQSNLRDGSVERSWVNLSTGAIGTKSPLHTIRVTGYQAWYKIEVVVNAGVGATATFFATGIATGDGVFSYAGDITKGIYLWGGGDEVDKLFSSSPIVTVATALARGADFYSLPFTATPNEISVYVKFVELGTLLASGRVFSIASAADANPKFVLGSTGSAYQAAHVTTAGTVVSVLAGLPAIGDTVELVARLFGDGSVDITQSINSGTATAGVQSAANALASAWSGQLVWLNSAGTSGSVGFTALRQFKIISGARSLAEMRAA